MTPATLTEVSLREQSCDDLLGEAVSFHGHLCPGQVVAATNRSYGVRGRADSGSAMAFPPSLARVPLAGLTS